jgi:organic radical activating enzyme
MDKLPNELIKDILKKNDIKQITGLCTSNKYFRAQCSEIVRKELFKEYNDDLGIYLSIKNKPFYITISTSDGEQRTKVIRSKDSVYKIAIELINEVCKNYIDVMQLDISSYYDNRKNPTMLNTMCFFYANDDENCIKMVNIVISGNFEGYEIDRLDDDIANYVENYLTSKNDSVSLSGGKPDPFLQNKLLRNLQKGRKIRVSLKNFIKKSKKRLYKTLKKKSPLKNEINGGSLKRSKKRKSRAQYYGKKSKVMVKVPENVKNTALYAFKLKKLGFGGGLETGWKRAKQLATKSSIPIQDLKYMRAWFSRHVYTSYPTYKKWKVAGRPKDSSWHKRHGIVSWLIWAADAGFKWVNSQKNINLLNKHYPGKNYKAIKLPK